MYRDTIGHTDIGSSLCLDFSLLLEGRILCRFKWYLSQLFCLRIRTRTLMCRAGTKHAATTSVSRLLFDADPNAFFTFEPDARTIFNLPDGTVVNDRARMLDVLWCNASSWAGGWQQYICFVAAYQSFDRLRAHQTR